MTATATPSRVTPTREDAMAALAIANHIRTKNAQTLRKLGQPRYAEGLMIVAKLLRQGDLDGPFGAVPARRLLTSVRSMGQTKAEALLYSADIHRHHRALRTLTVRQRQRLADRAEDVAIESMARRARA